MSYAPTVAACEKYGREFSVVFNSGKSASLFSFRLMAIQLQRVSICI